MKNISLSRRIISFAISASLLAVFAGPLVILQARANTKHHHYGTPTAAIFMPFRGLAG